MNTQRASTLHRLISPALEHARRALSRAPPTRLPSALVTRWILYTALQRVPPSALAALLCRAASARVCAALLFFSSASKLGRPRVRSSVGAPDAVSSRTCRLYRCCGVVLRVSAGVRLCVCVC